MKKIGLLTLVLSLGFLNTFAQSGGVIILEGNYQGKNLYIQNPFGSNGVGFCVSEVKVNGNITTDINGDAIVVLPPYFDALNKDCKYQLTCIGDFAQAIVKEEEKNN